MSSRAPKSFYKQSYVPRCFRNKSHVKNDTTQTDFGNSDKESDTEENEIEGNPVDEFSAPENIIDSDSDGDYDKYDFVTYPISQRGQCSSSSTPSDIPNDEKHAAIDQSEESSESESAVIDQSEESSESESEPLVTVTSGKRKRGKVVAKKGVKIVKREVKIGENEECYRWRKKKPLKVDAKFTGK